MDDNVVTAGVIVIGNEILSGRTQDTNLQFIAKYLVGKGISIGEAQVVPDIESGPNSAPKRTGSSSAMLLAPVHSNQSFSTVNHDDCIRRTSQYAQSATGARVSENLGLSIDINV